MALQGRAPAAVPNARRSRPLDRGLGTRCDLALHISQHPQLNRRQWLALADAPTRYRDGQEYERAALARSGLRTLHPHGDRGRTAGPRPRTPTAPRRWRSWATTSP